MLIVDDDAVDVADIVEEEAEVSNVVVLLKVVVVFKAEDVVEAVGQEIELEVELVFDVLVKDVLLKLVHDEPVKDVLMMVEDVLLEYHAAKIHHLFNSSKICPVTGSAGNAQIMIKLCR